MSLMTMLLIVWAGLTTVLVILLIYRSTVSMQEDDQLFLSDSETAMQQEQTAILRRLKSLQLPLRLLGGASGLLLLIMFGLWIWQGLSQAMLSAQATLKAPGLSPATTVRNQYGL